MAAGDFQLVVLSGSTSGLPIAVAATGSPGTTIHTAQSGTSGVDMVELDVTNIDTATRTLTLQWGGTTAAEQIGPISIAANRGPVTLQVPPLPLNGAKAILAYADVANKLNIRGRVMRFTNTA